MKRYISASKKIELSTANYEYMNSVMCELYHNYGGDEISKQDLLTIFTDTVVDNYPNLELNRTDIRKIGSALYNNYFIC